MEARGVAGCGMEARGAAATAVIPILTLLLLLPLACGSPHREDPEISGFNPRDARRVLLAAAQGDSASLRLAEMYASSRGVPADRIVLLDVPETERISLAGYEERIEVPVRRHLEEAGLRDSVDFILLLRGIPLLVEDTGHSVDALLGAMDLDLPLVRKRDARAMARLLNPYFRGAGPFHSRDYGFYLVTRLDGYTESQARLLMDSAARARPEGGPFLLDVDPARDTAGYRSLNDGLRMAAASLSARGMEAVLDTASQFAGYPEPLAGYCSWGSNDAAFSARIYHDLRFKPGALAETFVSSSGRTFRPAEGGQSLIADLVASGVTGVSGYVTEPLASALCRPEILFDRYVKGRTLAESFYAALPLLKWKAVIVGDPICAPYRDQAGISDAGEATSE